MVEAATPDVHGVVHDKGVGISWGALSDRGKVRQENEDAYLVEPEAGLFVVSDGMGGHRGGGLASQIVVEDLTVMIETGLGKLRSQSMRALRGLLKRVMAQQSRHLQMEGDSESGYKGMGATVVATLLRQGRVYVANIGDSRAYLCRAGRLKQYTRDHSVVGSLVRAGKLEPEKAEDHEDAGQLTRYVGMEQEAKPFVRSFQLVRGDRLLLCTDGLTDMVDEAGIGRVLTEQVEAAEACRALVAAANAAGGHDNITALVIDWQRI